MRVHPDTCGITAGGATAELLTIDLATGAATVVGSTGLERIGSIELGPAGVLYGGLTAAAASNATEPATCAEATVEPYEIPTRSPIGQAVLVLLVVAGSLFVLRRAG